MQNPVNVVCEWPCIPQSQSRTFIILPIYFMTDRIFYQTHFRILSIIFIFIYTTFLQYWQGKSVSVSYSADIKSSQLQLQ